VLVQAGDGWLASREQGDKVVFVRVEDPGTGQVFQMQELPGGALLVGAAAGWFVAREAGARVIVTRAGPMAIGNVILEEKNPGYQIRDFAGGVLIGAERGMFVGVPAPAEQACKW
jgi:hypothetical protein